MHIHAGYGGEVESFPTPRGWTSRHGSMDEFKSQKKCGRTSNIISKNLWDMRSGFVIRKVQCWYYNSSLCSSFLCSNITIFFNLCNVTEVQMRFLKDY